MGLKTIISTICSSLIILGCAGQTFDGENGKSYETSMSVQEFLNRPIYKELTSEILDTIPDRQLEQTIFDNIAEKLGRDVAIWPKKVKSLTIGQQAIFTTWIVEGDVDNGGFNQFYFNLGQFSEMAVIGFEILKAPKYADLMKRANRLYSSIQTDLEKYNDGTLERFSESYENNPLNELDTEFYSLSDERTLSDLRIIYIRENIDQFIQK